MSHNNQIIKMPLMFLSIMMFMGFALPSSAQQTFPYNGYLEQNGVPFDGQMPMRFYLVENPNDDESRAHWVEDHQVLVHNGRFSTVLGVTTPFGELFFSQRLYPFLGIMIQVDEQWQDLGNKKPLRQIPEAISAQEAKNFRISDALEVNRGALLRGNETDEFGNQSIPLRIRTRNSNSEMNLDGDEIESNGTLNLQQGTRNPTIVHGAFTVRSNTHIEGDLSVAGNFLRRHGPFHAVQRGQRAGGAAISDYPDGDGNGNPVSNAVIIDLDRTRSFCFLTRNVSVHDLPEEGGAPRETDSTECRIKEFGGGVWRLIAHIGGENSHLTAVCEARCISWQ